MTHPDKCPRCGAGVMLTGAGTTFLCDTWAMNSETIDQSRECTARQRDQLAERVKRLEEVGDKMSAAFDKEWLGDADIECIQDDWDKAKGQP